MGATRVYCYCGSLAHIKSNSLKYGREYGNGKAWFCDRWPECDGYVGTHPDGSPLGTLADKETQQYRHMVHEQIDPLWRDRKKSKKWARGQVYRGLRKLMSMTADECHIGKFTKDQCIEALEQLALRPIVIKGATRETRARNRQPQA